MLLSFVQMLAFILFILIHILFLILVHSVSFPLTSSELLKKVRSYTKRTDPAIIKSQTEAIAAFRRYASGLSFDHSGMTITDREFSLRGTERRY